MFRYYKAYMPKYYKWIVGLIYPAFAIFCCILVQNGLFGIMGDGFHPLVAAALLCNATCTVEITQDFFVFGGAYHKNASHFDFLKTSEKGMRMLSCAILADAIRRLLYFAGFNAINLAIGHFAFGYSYVPEDFELLGLLLMMDYLIASMAVIVTRFFDNFFMNLAAVYMVTLAVVVLNAIVDCFVFPMWVILVGALIISAGTVWLNVFVAGRRMERSYHD